MTGHKDIRMVVRYDHELGTWRRMPSTSFIMMRGRRTDCENMLRFFNKKKKDDNGQPNSGRERAECFDCGVPEGETHWNGCDKEICPFCLGQLISCGCCNEKLGLIDTQKYDESTDYLPPEIYKKEVTEEQDSGWRAM